jgi:HK97 family phage portal protein
MKLFDRAKSLLGFEGSARGPFNGMGELGGFYGIESLGDGWQRNLEIDTFSARRVPGVYACVMAISRAVSQCYPAHIRLIDGTHERVKTSAAYRVLRNPNSYQASPDFLLNLVAAALFDGESFAVATRNDRYEIDSLHLLPRGACAVRVDEDTRAIYYSIGSSPLAPGGVDYVAPARDVLHLRFHTPRHPLIGESPIRAAALAIGINVALSQNQAAFFSRMNRPSGILSTDQTMNADQAARLRAAFDEQSKKWAAGGMPILGGGLKFQALSISSQDAQLVEAQRMSLEDICRVFGVPPPMVGDLSHATLSNAESLIQNFLSMSLGSYLEHIERSFDRLFGLGNNEFIELDTAALLRTDFAGRVDGLTKAVQGGLMTPDEARAREGLSRIDGGDVAYLQRQMVPIDKINDLLEAEAARAAAPAPAPGQPKAEDPEPQDTPDAEEQLEEGKGLDVEVAKALLTAYMVNR